MDEGLSFDDGRWLVEHRMEMDRAEAVWLDHLARFDRDGLWALDGQLSCVSWLVWKLNMARSTAFEKLRVAHELRRRPVVADAFKEGRLSYSAVRAITRLERPNPDVDRALVELAESGEASILDLERVVRSYQLYADQERPPSDGVDDRRQVRIRRGGDGTGQVTVTLDDLELEEFAATFQAFVDLRYRAVGESSAGDADQTRGSKRADAFMDLLRTALAHADQGRAAGDDRYMVHLLHRDGTSGATLLDGTPLDAATGSIVCCDASSVAHTVTEGGEPLSLGRKTREWSSAQRRAITVRDGGCCRFVGCGFSFDDIHHLEWWEKGGSTDIDNGIGLCRRHHRLIHAGFSVEGDPNGELRFHRRDGSYIDSTYPVTAGGRNPYLTGPLDESHRIGPIRVI